MRQYLLGLMIILIQISFGQTAGTYQYDGNGNVIADSYNNIAFIQYDIDNLPITVYKTDGTKIEYSYNANGERVRKCVGSANTYYIQGVDGQTEAIANDDPTKTVFNIDKIGKAERQGSTWIRSYYLKDHLGTIKMTLADNGSIISYDDYYPFGLYMPDRSGRMGDAAGRYKFTGKERDVETGFDYFGARYYDSRIGRWMAVDPSAEKTPGWTPYRYGFNNPLRFYDPNGLTEKERLKMVEKARSLLGTKRGTEMSNLKGNNKMDCGVVIRLTTQEAGIKDPVWYGKGLGQGLTNSVARIASMGRISSLEKARIGDIAIFNTGSGDYAHVGQITAVHGENGIVTDFDFIECGGSGDKGEVRESKLSTVTNWTKGKYTLTDVYQIDTQDEEQKNRSSNNTVDNSNTLDNRSYMDKLKDIWNKILGL